MTRFQRNDSVLADLHDTLVCQHEFYAKLKKFMAGEMSFIKDGKGKSVTCNMYNLAKKKLFRYYFPVLPDHFQWKSVHILL